MEPCRHTLLYGFKTQLETDSSDTAQQLARFVIEERLAARLVDWTLRTTNRTPVSRTFAALNATRCYLRMRTNGPEGGVISCAYRANERRATDQLHAMLGTMPWCDLEFDFRGAAHELRGVPGASPIRLARIARMLERRYEPFRMLRAVEMLGYHARFTKILDEGRYRAAVMSSYSNPWGIAFNILARRRRIPIVLVMHGMPQWPLPRLDYDLAIVNSRAAHDTLLRAGCRIDRVIVKSGRSHYRPMPAALPRADATVGLLLSKDPVADRVTSWLRALARHPRIGAIVIRKHPANVWRLEQEVAGIAPGRISISSTPSSFDDIRRCDFVVAGNSSVHLEAVAAGVPSVYVPGMDRTSGDILGLAKDDLVLACEDAGALDLDDLVRFYARSSWLGGLRRHVNIDQDDDEVARETRAAFHALGVSG